jgi:hypothetical protein
MGQLCHKKVQERWIEFMVLGHEEPDRTLRKYGQLTVDRKVKFRSLWSGMKRKAYGILLGKVHSTAGFFLLNWLNWRKIRIV